MSEANDKLKQALHSLAMNTPCADVDTVFRTVPSGASQYLIYKLGHRDARHAIAEAVLSMPELAAPSPQPEAGGEATEIRTAIKDEADRAYMRYSDEGQKSLCLGADAKLRDGAFGRAELDAHLARERHFGIHVGLNCALELIGSLVAPASAPPSMREGDADDAMKLTTILKNEPWRCTECGYMVPADQYHDCKAGICTCHRGPMSSCPIHAALAAPPAGNAGGNVDKLLSAMESHASRPQDEWAEASKCLRYLSRDVRTALASRGGEGETR